MENNQEIKNEEVVETSPKKAVNNAAEVKALRQEVNELKDQLKDLINIFKNNGPVVKPEKDVEEVPVEEKDDDVSYNSVGDVKLTATDDISFVHLIERDSGLTTFVKLTTMELRLSTLGEIFTLSRQQADEFIGKYREWFDEGIFAVADDAISIKYAKTKRLKLAANYEIAKRSFEGIGKLNVYELEDLYNKLAPAHKDNILTYFKQKVYEASLEPEKRDPRFCDVQKLELLNRLSDCDALRYEIDDLRNLNKKKK